MSQIICKDDIITVRINCNLYCREGEYYLIECKVLKDFALGEYIINPLETVRISRRVWFSSKCQYRLRGDCINGRLYYSTHLHTDVYVFIDLPGRERLMKVLSEYLKVLPLPLHAIIIGYLLK